jgi:hypothetical protein
LLSALRKLPPRAAAELKALTERLASVNAAHVDWSDAWSESDLKHYSRSSLERLEDTGE